MRAVSVRLRGVIFACLVVLLVPPGSGVAADPSPAYLALLEAAKAEGKAVMGGFAFDPEEIATLEKGFKQRFGFPVKLTHGNSTPSSASARRRIRRVCSISMASSVLYTTPHW